MIEYELLCANIVNIKNTNKDVANSFVFSLIIILTINIPNPTKFAVGIPNIHSLCQGIFSFVYFFIVKFGFKTNQRKSSIKKNPVV